MTRRTGESVRIAETTLVAGKTVPPAPARRPLRTPPGDGPALRRIASDAWPAPETAALGDWRLQAGGGFTRRANSVLAHGDPGLPLPAALARVTAWYAERGLPAFLQVAVGTPLDDALAAHGWTAEGSAVTLTAPLPPLADLPGAEHVTLDGELTDAWLTRYHRTGALAPAARAVLTGGAAVWFATATGAGSGSGGGASGGGPEDGGPAAIGRVAVVGRWAVFAAVEVAASRRRQGLATAVMAALAGRAVREGATGALLQAETGNAAALALYARLGFTPGETHHYRRAPRPARE